MGCEKESGRQDGKMSINFSWRKGKVGNRVSWGQSNETNFYGRFKYDLDLRGCQARVAKTFTYIFSKQF